MIGRVSRCKDISNKVASLPEIILYMFTSALIAFSYLSVALVASSTSAGNYNLKDMSQMLVCKSGRVV